MTSLIFGSIYLGHKGIIQHRREKQRQKNYQRWEGLRDEYDEQRKISRESRSLDIQRTGTDYNRDVDNDRPILTLRDQQEANDARTGWRPQESWDGAASNQPERRSSVEVTSGSGLRPVLQHKTGAWDEGLPQPLRVSRRNWDDYQPSNLSANVSRSGSVRNNSNLSTPTGDRDTSKSPSINKQPSPSQEFSAPSRNSHAADHRSVSMPSPPTSAPTVEAIQYATPGGLMAELIESGNSTHSQQQTSPYSQNQQTPFSQSYQTPFSPPPQQGSFSHAHQNSYGGFQPNSYSSAAPVPQQQPSAAEEWWNRPL